MQAELRFQKSIIAFSCNALCPARAVSNRELEENIAVFHPCRQYQDLVTAG